MTHSLTLAAAGAVTLMLAVANQASSLTIWTAVTLSASIVSGLAVFWLNQKPDSPKAVFGRAVFCAITAVVGPRTLIYLVPPADQPAAGFWQHLAVFVTSDLILLFGAACGFAVVGYIMSMPAVTYLFQRAPEFVREAGEYYAGPPPSEADTDKPPPP